MSCSACPGRSASTGTSSESLTFPSFFFFFFLQNPSLTENYSHGTLQREEDALFSSARERLYPDTDTLTDTPRPHSLPLEAYTGTFSHRGYQSITLSIISKPSSSSSSSAASSSTSTPTLHASVTDRRLPFTLELEHVSDEHFVAYARWPDTDEKTATRAEFRIRADDDGTCQVVEAMVLGFQHDVSVDVVVFRRV